MLRKLEFKTILEIGAGDYSFDYIFNNRGNVSWVKVDLAPPCDVICDFNTDKLCLPFTENAFDLIICTELLEHLLWPQHLLKEAHRVLAREGSLIVSVPNVASLTYRIAWLMGHTPSCAASGNLPPELGGTAYQKTNGELIGGHVIDFSLQRLMGLLESSGFNALSARGSGIIWHRQIVPHWLVPVSLSSNIICLAKKVA